MHCSFSMNSAIGAGLKKKKKQKTQMQGKRRANQMLTEKNKWSVWIKFILLKLKTENIGTK